MSRLEHYIEGVWKVELIGLTYKQAFEVLKQYPPMEYRIVTEIK